MSSVNPGPALDCAGRLLDLSSPRVMGVLNVTPDSFSDGGTLYEDAALSRDRLLQRASAMVEAGVDILDIGGESTRPGAARVSLQEELDRVIPAVELLAAEFDVVLSVDTSSAEVITAAAAAGMGLINDVRSLTRPGALAAAAATGLPVCLMHMRQEPDVMQKAPHYQDVVADVLEWLQQRVAACVAAGIDRARLLVDPGFGFGKNLQHNLVLLNRLEALHALGLPLLVGMSRKTMISAALGGRDTSQRLPGGLALHAIAVFKGAHIVRVHDVAETVDAVRIAAAVRDATHHD